MEIEDAVEVRHRAKVPTKWEEPYINARTRAFDNSSPGVLSYRNAAIIMLLHTPLLINWVRDVHPENHRCDEKDLSLLCALWRLSTFYWLGDPTQDTHETYMKRVWDKLCVTSWKPDINREQDSWRFVEELFSQLFVELKDDAERQREVNELFQVYFKSRRICQYCKRESSLRHNQVLTLEASFKKGALAQSSYKVAEAFQHSQQLGMPSDGEPTWSCEECNRYNERSHSSNPISPLKYIVLLPEILFIRVEHTDSTGRTLGVLGLEDTMTIPADWQYPGIPRQDVQFELYSIIFRWTYDKKDGTIVEGDSNVCAVKEPGVTNKWALVQTGLVSNDLRLEDLLDRLDKKQRPVFLAYRRLPLSDEHIKPAQDPGVLIKQTISVREGVEWSFNQHLPFPDGEDRLSRLGGKARTHRTKFKVTIISQKTGEVLEGEATMSLALKKRKRVEASATAGEKKRGRPLGSVKPAKQRLVPNQLLQSQARRRNQEGRP